MELNVSTPNDAEYERLMEVLIGQIEGNAFLDARATVEAILRLRPDDQAALDATAFIESQQQTTGS